VASLSGGDVGRWTVMADDKKLWFWAVLGIPWGI
jgi:hypothetical protein